MSGKAGTWGMSGKAGTWGVLDLSTSSVTIGNPNNIMGHSTFTLGTGMTGSGSSDNGILFATTSVNNSMATYTSASAILAQSTGKGL